MLHVTRENPPKVPISLSDYRRLEEIERQWSEVVLPLKDFLFISKALGYFTTAKDNFPELDWRSHVLVTDKRLLHLAVAVSSMRRWQRGARP